MFAASVGSADADVDADAGKPIAAVWKEQHLRFSYMGRTSRYFLRRLRDKVRAMLLDLGARRDLTITALGCEGSAARARLGSLGPSFEYRRLSTPALAGAQPEAAASGGLGQSGCALRGVHHHRRCLPHMGVADCELVERVRASDPAEARHPTL